MIAKSSILIVDDDPSIREILVNVTKDTYPGVNVYDSRTGVEGLQRIKNMQFELVVMDYQLPGQSGKDIVKNIFKLEKNLRPKALLFVTGVVDEKTLLRGLEKATFDIQF